MRKLGLLSGRAYVRGEGEGGLFSKLEFSKCAIFDVSLLIFGNLTEKQMASVATNFRYFPAKLKCR